MRKQRGAKRTKINGVSKMDMPAALALLKVYWGEHLGHVRKRVPPSNAHRRENKERMRKIVERISELVEV